MENWSTYLLRCADASLYCGVTNDLEKRLASHNLGKASKYTRSRIPVTLAAARHKLSKSQAYKLEYIVKKTRTDRKIKILLDWSFSNEGG